MLYDAWDINMICYWVLDSWCHVQVQAASTGKNSRPISRSIEPPWPGFLLQLPFHIFFRRFDLFSVVNYKICLREETPLGASPRQYSKKLMNIFAKTKYLANTFRSLTTQTQNIHFRTEDQKQWLGTFLFAIGTHALAVKICPNKARVFAKGI